MKQSIQEFARASATRHNARSLSGMTIRNATGDINETSLGYQIAIDTLTFIKKQITEQKFYEVSPADYVPIAVGDGAFSQSLLTNLTVSTSRDFETGIIEQGTNNDRLESADAAISSKTAAVLNWAKAVGYSEFEIEQALQSNNWDIIESKHRARKKNWDLGIQKIAFLGILNDQTAYPGLLSQSQSNVNSDLVTIQESISSMSATQFGTFVSLVVASYQNNCAYTAMPTHFVIPQSDWLGLAAPVSTDYPFNSKLEYLKKAFNEIVPGGIKILPSIYGMPAYNQAVVNTGVGISRYAMYRYDPESLRMDIPVDYTVTQPNTLNNFQFQDAGYGQATGVIAYRQLELEYFDYAYSFNPGVV